MFFITASPRKVAKFATRVAVYAGSMYGTEAALNAIIGDQDDESPQTLHTGSIMIGAVAGYEISAHTDRLIDKVADKRLARKAEKKQESPLVAVAS